MIAASSLQGKTSTTERPVELSSNGSGIPKETEALLAEMPAEQQKQLSQLYFFLTQVSVLETLYRLPLTRRVLVDSQSTQHHWDELQLVLVSALGSGY